jgi:hypothetical protein
MPAPILHLNATVMCSHGGQATPVAPSAVVFVSGMPVVTIASAYVVAGCAFAPPTGNGPCVSGQWITGATSVFSQGQPVAIMSGASTCAPTGTPMLPIQAQTQVLAT